MRRYPSGSARPRSPVRNQRVCGEGIGIGATEVPGEHVRALAPGSRPRAPRPLALLEAHLDPGQRQSHRTGPAVAVVGVRDEHAGLGHAVALEHGEPMPASRAAKVEGSSGADPETHSRSAASSRDRGLAARRTHIVGTPNIRRRPGGGDGVEHGVDLEPGQDDRRRAGQQRAVQPDAEAVDVEQRQGQQQPVVGSPAPCDLDRRRGGQEVAVAQRHALRGAGRARREHQQRRVVRTRDVEGRRRPVGQIDVGPGGGHAGEPAGIVQHRQRRLGGGRHRADLAWARTRC